MATEIKKILSIDTTSLKEYKKHIDELRGSLLSLEKGSEEYKEVEEELTKETTKLSEVLKAGKKEVEYVSGSYYDLNKQLVEAKKQWKALSEEERNSDVGKNLRENIVNLDNQLKTLDSSIGQYQRNVGNYGSAFASAFKSAKDGLMAAIPSVNMFGNALKLLAANPVGAIITAIVLAVTALTKAMKGSEAQMKAFQIATAPIKILFDGIKNAISAVSEVLVKLAEKAQELMMTILKKARDFVQGLGWDALASKIDATIKKIEEYTEIEKAAQGISQRRREINEEIARTENKVSELRAKLAEKDKLTNAERLKLIDEWEKAEKHKAELEVQIAQEEYDLIKRQNALTESSTEDLDKESEAYIRLIKAQGSYNESMRTVNAQKAQLLKKSDQIISKNKEEDKSYQESHEKQMRLLEKKYDKELFYNDLLVENEKEKAEKRYSIEKKELEDKIKLQEDYVKEYGEKQKETISKFTGTLEERKKLEEKFRKEREKEEEKLADFREELERRVATEQKRIREQEQADLELNNEKKLQRLEKDAEDRKFYAELETEKQSERAAAVYEIERKLLEDKIALQMEYIENFKGTNEELIAEEQRLADLRIELEKKVAAEKKRLDKQQLKDEKTNFNKRYDYAMSFAGSLGGVFDAIADMSEEGSKEQKAFSIMAATISTLASVVGVVRSVWTDATVPTVWAKIAMSAALSAGVIASGIAQISKMKSTTKENSGNLSSGGSASFSTVPNVGVTPLLNETADIQSMQSLNINGDSESNGYTKVYVVAEEITAVQNDIKTRVSNATF